MAEPLSIPERLEEVTPEWLTAALRRSGVLGDLRVTGTVTEILGEGEGFLGDIARLRLTYDSPAGGPASVIVKLPKLVNRSLGELLGAYERENCFYQELAAQVPVATPRLYYADFDRDASSERQEQIMALIDRLPAALNGRVTQIGRWITERKARRYVLVIEDLEGAEPGDQLAGVSIERCRETLEAIARMHAAFWRSSELRGRFWLMPFAVDARLRHGLFVSSRPAFEAAFPELLDSELPGTLDWLRRHGWRAVRHLAAEGGETLLHCDLRLDNVAYRGSEPVFFDWQLVRRGPAVYDVAYFLSGAIDELPEAEERALVRRYHQALLAGGVSDYPFEALWQHYRLAMLAVLQTLTTADQVELGEGRGRDLLRAWIGRLAQRLPARNERGAVVLAR